MQEIDCMELSKKLKNKKIYVIMAGIISIASVISALLFIKYLKK